MAEKKKLTPYQEEKLKCAKQVKEYKVACEANIVSIFYKKPELMYDYQLKLEDFSENTWRVYWQIAYDIIVKEKKSVLDDITVGLYLEKHSKLKQKYDEYGGYDTIDKATEYIKTSNISGYVNELKKWETVIRMIASGFPVTDRIKEFVDMSLDEIYKEYDALLNHIFINAEEDVMSYPLSDGIYDLIEQLNEGIAVGLPYDNMPTLTKETGGQLPGNITLVGGLSNMGKTTLTRTMLIPSAVKYGERLVILVNEEGKAKWQRELIVWVANNIYKTDLQKFVVRDGKFSDEVKELLYKCADWIAEKSENNMLTIIPFDNTGSSLGNCEITDEQVRILISLDVEIVIALDEGIDINHIRKECEKFYPIRKVSYIYDKWDLIPKGSKNSPADMPNKIYNFLFKHRTVYDEKERKLYKDWLEKQNKN